MTAKQMKLREMFRELFRDEEFSVFQIGFWEYTLFKDGHGEWLWIGNAGKGRAQPADSVPQRLAETKSALPPRLDASVAE